KYNRLTYRQAVARACDKAFPHPTFSSIPRKGLTPEQRLEIQHWRRGHRWCPLQLRHTVATLVTARFGIEAAANVLGHANRDTTLIYAERDLDRARAVVAEIG